MVVTNLMAIPFLIILVSVPALVVIEIIKSICMFLLPPSIRRANPGSVVALLRRDRVPVLIFAFGAWFRPAEGLLLEFLYEVSTAGGAGAVCAHICSFVVKVLSFYRYHGCRL